MAHPVIDDTKDEKPKVKTIYQTIVRASETAKRVGNSLLDSLVLLTIAFWYFFWTGLAILLNRKIPQEWLKIATKLSKERLAKKIANPQSPKENSIKVVDLETNKPITLKP